MLFFYHFYVKNSEINLDFHVFIRPKLMHFPISIILSIISKFKFSISIILPTIYWRPIYQLLIFFSIYQWPHRSVQSSLWRPFLSFNCFQLSSSSRPTSVSWSSIVNLHSQAKCDDVLDSSSRGDLLQTHSSSAWLVGERADIGC